MILRAVISKPTCSGVLAGARGMAEHPVPEQDHEISKYHSCCSPYLIGAWKFRPTETNNRIVWRFARRYPVISTIFSSKFPILNSINFPIRAGTIAGVTTESGAETAVHSGKTLTRPAQGAGSLPGTPA